VVLVVISLYVAAGSNVVDKSWPVCGRRRRRNVLLQCSHFSSRFIVGMQYKLLLQHGIL